MKHLKASSGVATMGSPRTLKLVFTKTGQPVLEFDLEIEIFLHRGRAGIGENRGGAERSRPELEAALTPADRLLRGERLRRLLDERIVIDD